MKPHNAKLQIIISCVFTFILTLLLVILYLCVGFNFGVFNSKTVSRELNESNYYDEVYQEIYGSVQTLVTEAGFPTSVMEEVITFERVYIAGQNYMKAVLSGSEFEIKTDKIRDELTDNIYQYLLEEDLQLTQDLDVGIEILVSAVAEDYTEGQQLQFLHDFVEYRDNFLSTIWVLLPILIVLIGFLCYFLIRMQIYIHRGVRYIVYAISSSSLLTVFAAGYLLITEQYAKITIVPDYYKDFIAAYLRWDITVFIYISGIAFTAAIALISLISFLKNGIVDN